jgi:hypothetical protein
MAALAACLALTATSFLMRIPAADPAPAISVVSVFLHGKRYPDNPHRLKLRLASAKAEVSTETSLPVFSEFKPNPGFALPLNRDLLFSITEGARRLVQMAITRSGETINVSHSCQVLVDFSNSFLTKFSLPTFLPVRFF